MSSQRLTVCARWVTRELLYDNVLDEVEAEKRIDYCCTQAGWVAAWVARFGDAA